MDHSYFSQLLALCGQNFRTDGIYYMVWYILLRLNELTRDTICKKFYSLFNIISPAVSVPRGSSDLLRPRKMSSSAAKHFAGSVHSATGSTIGSTCDLPDLII